jgi:glucuronate isomerase
MAYLDDDFLLATPVARRLFHEVARDLPVIDYHNHLDPAEILADRRWDNLSELWLGGDHYKWRAMRANGIAEDLITGPAEPYDKFLAWAATVPKLLRNPLYDWTHLELRRAFGWDGLLGPDTAAEVWDLAGRALAAQDFSARGLLRRFKVEVVGTTDDPGEPLASHQALREGLPGVAVCPTFRPDAAFLPHLPERFLPWLDKLGTATGGGPPADLESFLAALDQRHADFHACGARLSDHSLPAAPDRFLDQAAAAATFARARAREPLAEAEIAGWTGFLLARIAAWNHHRGWAMQLHLGAVRNPNSRMFRQTGPDSGFDTIGDEPRQAARLLAFLDHCEMAGSLPRVIVYNLNPADNYPLCAALGSFQGGGIPGKLQFGSGWWFLDQLEGMSWQLGAVSNLGLLSRFIGMLTDSRSFLSFPRHEYFRRLLCGLVGGDAAAGRLPDDFGLLTELVSGVCYQNARAYFAFPCHAGPPG